MEHNLVGFEFCWQKIKDVLNAIETIKPVVNLIRDSYKVNERLEEIHEDGIEANGKIEAYSEILNMKPNKNLTKKLESKIEKLNTSIEEGVKEHKELSEHLEGIEEDLSEYLKYILTFDWINIHIVVETLSRISNKDYEKFIAAVLLFTNESIKKEERSEILDYISRMLEDESFRNVINNMFFGEEYDTLIEYISTTNLLNE